MSFFRRERERERERERVRERERERVRERVVQLNSATIRNNRYKGKLVSANVIDLSSWHLSGDEISLL